MEKSTGKIWRASSGKSPFQRRNQNYWKGLLESLADACETQNTLQLPSDPQLIHPLSKTMRLLLCLVRGLLQSQGLSETASTIILQAWRCGTIWQYSSYPRRWEQYCSTRKVDPISATVIDRVNFLSELYQKELSYSAINTTCAALSAVIHLPEGCMFGHHPLVTRFLKGVFTARPALPCYQEVWDVCVSKIP